MRVAIGGIMMVGILLAALLAMPQRLQADPAPTPEAADPAQLARVWRNTLVVFPQNPASVTGRADQLPTLLDWYGPAGKLPAVIFLHGCSGLHMGSSQVTRMIRSFAAAGFVVFAPNSLDRPRIPYCTGVGETSGTDNTALTLRLAELEMVRAKLSQMPWIDQDNLFAAGHSLGGWTLSQYSGTAFRALAPFGLTCQSARVLQNRRGIQAPDSVPVIVLQGDADEWYPTLNLKVANCGAFAEMKRPNRQHLLLPGIPHDVSRDPAAMLAVIDFFRRSATHPIQPMSDVTADGASARFDGTWNGTIACAAHGGVAAFTLRPALAVRGGRFRWRIQVATGTRGFDGQITDSGTVSALGLIVKTEVLEPGDPRANLAEAESLASWPVALDARIAGNRMSGMAVWSNQPCTVEMTRQG